MNQHDGICGTWVTGGNVIAGVHDGVCGGVITNGNCVAGVHDGLTAAVIAKQPTEALAPLTITNFEITAISMTFARLNWTTSAPTICRTLVRRETPLGSWVSKPYIGAYHTDHSGHITPTLVAGQWYHLYVKSWDVPGQLAMYPNYPPWYYRFKSASRTAAGIDDGVYQEGD